MAINTWFSPEQRRYVDTRKAIRKADQQERKRAQDAAERAELWAWYANDYDVADSFAQEHALELKRQNELRAEINATVLLSEADKPREY